MLTDVQCRNAVCPPDRAKARFADSGGLYLQVSPAGSKRWFWKYRVAGVEKQLALGSYPAVSLMAARKARDTAKLQKAGGVDPAQARQVERLKAGSVSGETFEEVALEWHTKQLASWSPGHADRAKRQFERDLFPWLGRRRLKDITPVELLAAVRKIEDRGAIETADRALMLCRQVWAYGIATGMVERDVTVGLKKALKPYRGTHFAAITDPADFGLLLRAIKGYHGGVVVRSALQLAPLVFQRPGELRATAWAEIDLDGALWTIPAERMKRGREGKEHGAPHVVPLSHQAVAILRELHPYTGRSHFVFPGERSRERPMSENAVRVALMAMGYGSSVHTWHGFRASARTMLAEQLECDPLVIEAQLAHEVKDANGRAYNRTQYLKQRTVMMQRWADYLDRLRDGAQIIAMPSRSA